MAQVNPSKNGLPAYISLLGDGRYMANIPLGRDADTGVHKYARPKSRDLDEVIKRRDEVLAKLKAGDKVGPREAVKTTGEWATHCLENIVGAERSAATYDNYKWVTNTLIRNAPKGVKPLGPIPFPQLTIERMEQWRTDLERAGVGIPSINYAIARLRYMYSVALKRQMPGITQNRAQLVTKLKLKKTTPYVGSPAETRAMIEAAGEDYMASVIQVATDAGLRRSEICGLQWGDINWDDGTLTLRRHVVASGDKSIGQRATRIIPGTKESDGEEETVQISDRALAMLRQTKDILGFLGRSWKAGATIGTRRAAATKDEADWNRGYDATRNRARRRAAGLRPMPSNQAIYVTDARARTGIPYAIPSNPTADDAFVWPSADGTLMEPSSLGNWFAKVAELAGIKGKTLHDMRHDCATFMIGAGEPISVVAAQMRHKDASITASTYVHLLKDQEKRARNTFNALWSAVYADEETAQAV